jgi:hypothetical protein
MYRGMKLLIVCLLFPVSEICAQELSHQVMVPLAGVVCGSKLSYSQTVGETAVEMVGCFDFVFTQGFQQPGIKFSKETPPPGTGVNVYPNPVQDYLTFELFGDVARTLRIEILNITGTIVYSDKKTFSCQYWYREQLNVEDLIKGIYLVRIMSEDGFISRTFKIEKF